MNLILSHSLIYEFDNHSNFGHIAFVFDLLSWVLCTEKGSPKWKRMCPESLNLERANFSNGESYTDLDQLATLSRMSAPLPPLCRPCGSAGA